ncbi:hypothetical protein COLO4_23153 [Corchorus olitorius]|uniref:Uncharacterized protein n=1 Tax=Corchorus olitorius TaxID=93759 RepID=A0A1R3II00_9ROSI|nr:hypothetical protein COLO4_23153 [Corchorus olitorius]
MVKAVIGEETRLQLAEDRLSQSSLPAQLSSTLDRGRGFVFDLVPTPLNDAGQPACFVLEPAKSDREKGLKPKSQTSDSSSSLVIDKDWVAEHVRQTVKGVPEAALVLEDVMDERLLIYIWYSPRR